MLPIYRSCLMIDDLIVMNVVIAITSSKLKSNNNHISLTYSEKNGNKLFHFVSFFLGVWCLQLFFQVYLLYLILILLTISSEPIPECRNYDTYTIITIIIFGARIFCCISYNINSNKSYVKALVRPPVQSHHFQQ